MAAADTRKLRCTNFPPRGIDPAGAACTPLISVGYPTFNPHQTAVLIRQISDAGGMLHFYLGDTIHAINTDDPTAKENTDLYLRETQKWLTGNFGRRSQKQVCIFRTEDCSDEHPQVITKKTESLEELPLQGWIKIGKRSGKALDPKSDEEFTIIKYSCWEGDYIINDVHIDKSQISINPSDFEGGADGDPYRAALAMLKPSGAAASDDDREIDYTILTQYIKAQARAGEGQNFLLRRRTEETIAEIQIRRLSRTLESDNPTKDGQRSAQDELVDAIREEKKSKIEADEALRELTELEINTLENLEKYRQAKEKELSYLIAAMTRLRIEAQLANIKLENPDGTKKLAHETINIHIKSLKRSRKYIQDFEIGSDKAQIATKKEELDQKLEEAEALHEQAQQIKEKATKKRYNLHNQYLMTELAAMIYATMRGVAIYPSSPSPIIKALLDHFNIDQSRWVAAANFKKVEPQLQDDAETEAAASEIQKTTQDQRRPSSASGRMEMTVAPAIPTPPRPETPRRRSADGTMRPTEEALARRREEAEAEEREREEEAMGRLDEAKQRLKDRKILIEEQKQTILTRRTEIAKQKPIDLAGMSQQLDEIEAADKLIAALDQKLTEIDGDFSALDLQQRERTAEIKIRRAKVEKKEAQARELQRELSGSDSEHGSDGHHSPDTEAAAFSSGSSLPPGSSTGSPREDSPLGTATALASRGQFKQDGGAGTSTPPRRPPAYGVTSDAATSKVLDV